MKTKLTKETLKGVWVCLSTPFDKRGRFDADTFIHMARKVHELGADGIYTTGGASEFYAVEIDEYKQMIDALAEAVRGLNIPTQAGCTWFNTAGVVERVEYASEKGINGAQIGLPMWVPLQDREVLRFFQDIAGACPGYPIIHYNTGACKRYLYGKDYKILAGEVSELIGTKWIDPSFPEWIRLQLDCPELAHLAVDGTAVPFMMTGATGFCTSYFFACPEECMELYRLCTEKKWDEAMRLQWRINEFYHRAPYEDKYSDAAWDKALASVCGYFTVDKTTRAPYIPMTDAEAQELKDFVEAWRNRAPGRRNL
jgi:dihydrodipicolinate synthase/N-acetylneuraminate lyase